ncbi:MAG: ATP-binding cassette domain-containing protein [Phoenicibacter congonensis]|uniref:ATP-binding cassette domain-containing protein n=1 Tax=Phoenicibacter congonensis TaxID=1944646 RepID=A0AA43RH32_9ACTN|nr:ATP-binding cassette domain-containing protein [Phoenicibacter congonensis]
MTEMIHNLDHSHDAQHHHHTHAAGSVHEHGHHLVQLDDVTLRITRPVYEKRKLFPSIKTTTVLKDLSISLHAKEILFIVGETGAGKSMLANLLVGKTPKGSNVEGTFWFDGNIADKAKLEKIARENISFIPQPLTSLNPLNKFSYQEKSLYPHEMSGGMQRSALIHDALKPNTQIIIADEPTEGLDAKKARAVMSELVSLRDDGVSLIVVTHDIDLALNFADRIAIFKDGNIVEETSSASFYDKSKLRSDFAQNVYDCLNEKQFEAQKNQGRACELEISNLSVSYDRKNVISGLSTTISSNDVTCIFGDTGCGKSTLCKAIAGFLKPNGGQITCTEQGGDEALGGVTKTCDAAANEDLKTSPFVANQVTLIPQNPFMSFDPKMTINESLREVNAENSHLIDKFELKPELIKRFPSELSGGELQRFAIVRALEQKPAFLIMDEATSMLDIVTQSKVFKVVCKNCADEGIGVVFVTHDKRLRDTYSTRVINL